MNKLKPYMFWIVCGVLLLAEIIVMLVVTPTDQDGKTPDQTIQSVDQQNTKFKALVVQAKNGPPGSQVFDPLSTEQMAKLMQNYLDTPLWKRPLDEELDQYTTQMTSIRDYLVGRSAPLHEPISTSNENNIWYDEYQRVTAELLKGLYENKCLILPKKTGFPGAPPTAQPGGAGSPGSAGIPPSGTAQHGAPGTGAAADPAPDADAEPDFLQNKQIRQVGGFMTRTTGWPDQEPHGGVLTMQYRMMKEIAEVLESTKATNEVSVIDPKRPPYEEHAKLVKTIFADDDRPGGEPGRVPADPRGAERVTGAQALRP